MPGQPHHRPRPLSAGEAAMQPCAELMRNSLAEAGVHALRRLRRLASLVCALLPPHPPITCPGGCDDSSLAHLAPDRLHPLHLRLQPADYCPWSKAPQAFSCGHIAASTSPRCYQCLHGEERHGLGGVHTSTRRSLSAAQWSMSTFRTTWPYSVSLVRSTRNTVGCSEGT